MPVDLHTKDGKPLRVKGDKIFDRSGRQVGKLKGAKVFGPDGQYVGTVVGDRVIYRATHSASISSPFAPAVAAPLTAANRAPSSRWGTEPFE